MRKMKQFFRNISPVNDRTEMPVILYIIKVIIIFWFVKFVSELIGEGVVLALHFACGKNPLQGELFDYNTITLITYYGYGLMVGIMILYWKVFQKKTISELGFSRRPGSYLIGVLAGAILVVLSVLSVVLTGSITYHGVFRKIDYTFLLLMPGGFICQGAMEEVLCRGIALQLLRKRTSIPVATGVSSVLFVIPHLSKMTEESAGIICFAIVNLMLISLVFSLLTLYFKSIWAACGFHAIWNFVLCNVFGMNLSGNDEMTTAVFDMRSVGSSIFNGGSYGIEASCIVAAILAMTVVMTFAMCKRKGGVENGL